MTQPNTRALLPKMAFARLGADAVGGYVFDPGDLDTRFVILLLANGAPAASVLANHYHAELAADGVGDGHYGFLYVLPPELKDSGTRIEAVIANLGLALPPLAAPHRDAAPVSPVLPRGAVDPCPQLTLTGWVQGNDAAAPLVRVLLDGDEISSVRAHGWRHLLLDGQRGLPVRAFAVTLPAAFGDGRVRYVSVVDERGSVLVGSPMPVFAASDGLEKRLADLAETPGQRLRLDLFDQRFPASVPFGSYEIWRAALPTRTRGEATPTAAVVTVGKSNADYVFEPGALAHIVREAAPECDAFVFTRAGTVLEPDALAVMANALAAHPEAPGAYADIDIVDADGRRSLAAWPAFDYERLLEQGYVCEVFALRRSAVMAAIDAGASSLFRLALSPYDARGAEAAPMAHIPGPLGVRSDVLPPAAAGELTKATAAHLEARGVAATVAAATAGSHGRAIVRRSATPPRIAVSIFASAGHERLTEAIADFAPGCRKAGASIHVSPLEEGQAGDWPADIEVTCAPVERTRISRAARLNRAVRACHADVVMLVSDALRPDGDDWLRELTARIAETGVAAAAPLIASEAGIVLDAGWILSGAGGALPLAQHRRCDEHGYLGLLQTARSVSAVSCDAILLDRACFEAAGGFDEKHFPDAFTEVDLCLALQEAGNRIVWTPDARFVVRADALLRPGSKVTTARGMDVLRYRWPEAIADDRFYSPLLARDRPYEALAAAPAALDARPGFPARRRAIPDIW